MRLQVISKYKTAITAVILVVAAGPFVPQAMAGGDAARGEMLGDACLSCHGSEDYRNADPTYRAPKLGGQKASYLLVALKAYRDGHRRDPTMAALAGTLTDQEMADVAAYFASLGNETVATGGSPGGSFKAARNCGACHGQNGIGLSPGWPTLAGQYEDYLVHAINQYRNGKRQGPVMVPLVSTLSDDTIALLAKYFSSLEGLRATEVK
jgi:cytochrome c553